MVYGFLFVFYSNYDSIFSQFGDAASKNDLTFNSGFEVVQGY